MNDKTIAELFFKRDGRLNRWRYFKRNAVLGLSVGLFISIIAFMTGEDMGNVPKSTDVILFVVSVLMLVPSYCLMVRRLHDFDRDEALAKVYVLGCAALSFLQMVLKFEFMPLAVVLCIVSLYILFMPGTKGANKYGADPLRG